MDNQIPSQQGLTVIELMISVAVIGLLMVTAVPALGGLLERQRLATAITGLQSSLQLARNHAITSGQATMACPGNESGCRQDGIWHHGWIVFVDISGDREYQDGEPLLDQGQPPDNVHIIGSSYRRRLQFFANGTAPGSTVSIYFCGGQLRSQGKLLTLSNSGRIQRKSLIDNSTSSCTD